MPDHKPNILSTEEEKEEKKLDYFWIWQYKVKKKICPKPINPY